MAVFCFLFGVTASRAQLLPDHAFAEVIVHPKATAADQFRQASALRMKIYETRTPEDRFKAIAETFQNLEVIPKLWPNDTNTVLKSAVVLGDLALEWHFPNVAIAGLKDTVHLATGSVYEPDLERRLGESYSEAQQFDEAETHFKAAERSLHSVPANAVQVQGVLTASARFYAYRRHNPREAITRYRQLAEWKGQDPVVQVMAALASARLAVKLTDEPDKATAKQELASLDRHINDARGAKRTPEDAAVVETVAREVTRLRKE
jgi:tetratricopeptide (TPR) repeat protein